MSEQQHITDGKVVTMQYALTNAQGVVVREASGTPVSYVHGAGAQRSADVELSGAIRQGSPRTLQIPASKTGSASRMVMAAIATLVHGRSSTATAASYFADSMRGKNVSRAIVVWITTASNSV